MCVFLSSMIHFLLSECPSASGGIIPHAGIHTGSGVSREVFPKLTSGQWQCSVPPMATPEYLPLSPVEGDLLFSFPTDVNITCYPCLEPALRQLQCQRHCVAHRHRSLPELAQQA